MKHERRKNALTAGLAAVLFAGLLLGSCEQPAGTDPVIPSVAQATRIVGISGGGAWNVASGEGERTLTVTATRPDGGTLSYQWYRGYGADYAEGDPLEGEDGDALILAKADYARDGSRYFYVEVTNAVPGMKEAAATSAVTVNVTGNVTHEIAIASAAELAKIGSAGYQLAGTYTLTADLELDSWEPISRNKAAAFTGVFDGGGHKITLNGFSASALENSVYLGIFGYVRGIRRMQRRR